jgi:hypothetical protein
MSDRVQSAGVISVPKLSTHPILLFTRACLLGIMALTLAANSSDSQFQHVVRNPRAYHDKRVRIVAMADVTGDHFALYYPPLPKTADDFKRQIFVALRYNPRITSYDKYDKRLVEVTGVIDATRHGRFGGYACEIVADRIRFAR